MRVAMIGHLNIRLDIQIDVIRDLRLILWDLGIDFGYGCRRDGDRTNVEIW